jgi:hypothetical protein
MMTKIPPGGSGISNRTGSCSGLVGYLEKEQAGLWFSHDCDRLAGHEVIAETDRNKRNLGRDDDKYYQLIFAPSQAELAHIGSDPERLQAFTRAAMEAYAANFGKGIGSADLVWFAKIEHSRTYDYTDRAVQLGEVEKGTAKAGDQTHVHVIVSRTENLQTYAIGKKNGYHQRKNPFHLSPLTNHKATAKGPVTGGFERNAFALASERAFDLVTDYERRLVESFAYKHALKYGDELTKTAMREAAAREQEQEGPKDDAAGTNLFGMTFSPIRKSKQPEGAKKDDLSFVLEAAYQQKDNGDLANALARAEQERRRQAQQRYNEELQREPTPDQKAAQERKTQQAQQQQPNGEKTPQTEQKRPKTGPKL